MYGHKKVKSHLIHRKSYQFVTATTKTHHYFQLLWSGIITSECFCVRRFLCFEIIRWFNKVIENTAPTVVLITYSPSHFTWICFLSCPHTILVYFFFSSVVSNCSIIATIKFNQCSHCVKRPAFRQFQRTPAEPSIQCITPHAKILSNEWWWEIWI